MSALRVHNNHAPHAQAFKGLRSLILSTVFNATTAEGGNPLWPGIGYEGPDAQRSQKPIQARLQAEAVLQQAVLHVGDAPCKDPQAFLKFIRSGVDKAFCSKASNSALYAGPGPVHRLHMMACSCWPCCLFTRHSAKARLGFIRGRCTRFCIACPQLRHLPPRQGKPASAPSWDQMLTCQAHIHGRSACHSADGESHIQAVGIMLNCHVCLQSIYLEGDRRDHPRDAIMMTADAVICGSGAGGGVLAALLAEAGAKAGPFPLSSSTLCHWSPALSCIRCRALELLH